MAIVLLLSIYHGNTLSKNKDNITIHYSYLLIRIIRVILKQITDPKYHLFPQILIQSAYELIIRLVFKHFFRYFQHVAKAETQLPKYFTIVHIAQ